jgi:hypothetical protein
LVVKQDLSSEDSHSIAKFGRGGKKIIHSFLVAKKKQSLGNPRSTLDVEMEKWP